MIFKICKTPPRLILPVCVGSCPSTTHWDFRLNRFVTRLSACTVTNHRIEQFLCPDATHTLIDLVIPLACSCEKYHCPNQKHISPANLFW